MKGPLTEIGTSLRAVVLVAVTLCGVYPAAVRLLDRALFPARSEGSLVRLDDRVVGSRLLSQAFREPRYFHPRPSAAGAGHDASRSGATNLGPTSKRLFEDVSRRAADYRNENGLPARTAVPADAVTASASGLDPHISPENARLQAGRVARARGLPEEDVLRLVRERTEGRTLGFLGRPRVNVLILNLALDGVVHEGR